MLMSLCGQINISTTPAQNPDWNITAQVTAHSHEEQLEIPNGLREGFRLGSGLGWGYIAQSKGDL